MRERQKFINGKFYFDCSDHMWARPNNEYMGEAFDTYDEALAKAEEMARDGSFDDYGVFFYYQDRWWGEIRV